MMFSFHAIDAHHVLRLVQLREDAQRARFARHPQQRPARRVRRLVGRSMVAVGRRLAADPVRSPARSR